MGWLVMKSSNSCPPDNGGTLLNVSVLGVGILNVPVSKGTS